MPTYVVADTITNAELQTAYDYYYKNCNILSQYATANYMYVNLMRERNKAIHTILFLDEQYSDSKVPNEIHNLSYS